MTIWFYSDPHFDQSSMVDGKYTIDGDKLRPFETVEEMNETIVANHNAVVKPSDHVYCLGDFAMKKESVEKWAPRLNGHGRILLGNHDIFGYKFYARFFEKVGAYRYFDDLLFSHIPVAPWSCGARVNVHGHCHRSKPLFYDVPNPDARGFVKSQRYVNISLEHTNYRPVSLEEIRSWLRRK